MPINSLSAAIARRLGISAASGNSPRRRWRYRRMLRLEPLEDRMLLAATFTRIGDPANGPRVEGRAFVGDVGVSDVEPDFGDPDTGSAEVHVTFSDSFEHGTGQATSVHFQRK